MRGSSRSSRKTSCDGLDNKKARSCRKSFAAFVPELHREVLSLGRPLPDPAQTLTASRRTRRRGWERRRWGSCEEGKDFRADKSGKNIRMVKVRGVFCTFHLSFPRVRIPTTPSILFFDLIGTTIIRILNLSLSGIINIIFLKKKVIQNFIFYWKNYSMLNFVVCGIDLFCSKFVVWLRRHV